MGFLDRLINDAGKEVVVDVKESYIMAHIRGLEHYFKEALLNPNNSKIENGYRTYDIICKIPKQFDTKLEDVAEPVKNAIQGLIDSFKKIGILTQAQIVMEEHGEYCIEIKVNVQHIVTTFVVFTLDHNKEESSESK